LHEGFGFPVVEAMACGCPVICSNRTSLPELGGDAVLYFDPTNPYELAEKIVGILENKKMQEELQKKGLKQVKKFTKERFDKETKQVYELVKNKQTVAGLWDEAAKNPETEKVRGPYLTEIFLIPIMKAIKKIEAVQGKKTKRILKVDLWNEGIDFERNILKHIKTAENRLYGIDVSHHVCASAKKATENINIANASITKLPFKDHHFEILADLSTLDHLPKEKVEEIMKEYNRVMANNGYFVLIFDWWGIIWKIYMFYLEKVRGHGDYFFKNKGMQSRYIHPIGFIKKILRRNDFSIEEEYCIDYTGWTWNRVTKPVWDKYGSKIHDKMLGIEYSRLSKYLRPFAKQYVIIARKKEAV
jgi:SAM-dependent methyltransferase